ncbi:MAG TPA: hypothetical protein ENO38_05285 [Nitrososphaeria archaeon]|nr:hypothetical protein [Nitrososphaeria archaeon]
MDVQDLRLEDNDRLLRAKVETEEDLWALYATIRPGDVVFSRTSRELRGDGGGSRRKAMTLGVRVKELEYQPFTNRLRIRGVIEASPKELDLVGQHHTLSIEPGMELAIRREDRWRAEDLAELKRLSKGATYRALVVAVDDEEYAIALVHGSGVQELVEKDMRLPGKDQPEERERAQSSAMSEIARQVRRAIAEHGVHHLIVAGPAHWKEDLAALLRDLEGSGVRMLVDSTSYGGIKGIYEVLRRDAVKEVLREAILMEELEAMDRINSIAARDPDLLAYSLEGVEEAVLNGAAEEVVVDSGLIRSPDAETSRRTLRLLDEARRTRTKITVLESKHPELRVWISSFGGIVAILRYRMRRERSANVYLGADAAGGI